MEIEVEALKGITAACSISVLSLTFNEESGLGEY